MALHPLFAEITRAHFPGIDSGKGTVLEPTAPGEVAGEPSISPSPGTGPDTRTISQICEDILTIANRIKKGDAMTTAIQQAQPIPLAAFSQEQRDLIKRTVAPDATNDELAMFLHVAAKSGLDPLQKQIWFVKRSGRVTIQAGIDGLQARAAREPDYEGMTYGVVCEKDAFAFDATTGAVKEHTYNPFGNRGATLGAWCIVRRRGLLPFTAMVRFSEYVQAQSPLWQSKPAVMIEKVARSTALRRAYPEALSGIYAPEEMGDKAHFQEEEKAVEAQPIPSRAAEAKRLEAVPPAPPQTVEAHTVGGSPGVTLVDRAQEKGKTFKEIREAAKKALGDKAGPAPAWSEKDTAAVEAVLFPVAG